VTDIDIAELGPAILFCPGDRPDRFQKAVAAADLAVLDLEDGAAPANKDMARDAVVAWLRGAQISPMVRINLPSTARGLADATAVMAAGARVLLLPKTESAEEIDAVAALGPAALIATIESARGAQAISEIMAHPAIRGACWGPYDLSGDLGMRRFRDDQQRLLPTLTLVRDRLLLATAAERKVPIEVVTAEIRDLDLLARESTEAADLGFRAKFAIHPSQISVIRAAFRPTEAAIDRARRMLAASEGRGAFMFEGEMIDEALLRRQRHVLAAAARADAKD
jgi:citrate lyase subunit beta / citryl-CoA lyase